MEREFCIWTTWVTSVAFGATGVVSLWGGWYVHQFWGDAILFLAIATVLLRVSQRF